MSYQISESRSTVDSLYVEDARKIRQYILNIQTKTSFLTQMLENAPLTEVGKVRKTIHEELKTIRVTAQKVTKLLKDFAGICGGTSIDRTQRRLMHQRFNENFQEALKSVENVALNHLTKECLGFDTGNQNPMDETDSSDRSNEESCDRDKILQNEQESHVEGDLRPATAEELNAMELQERQHGIRMLQDDIQGIHELYQELKSQALEQNELVETIENQLQQAGIRTLLGTQQLQAAVVPQSRYRKRIIFLILIIVGILLIWFFQQDMIRLTLRKSSTHKHPSV
eukprot:GHVL01020061.1.p1 GENE.GHVL01020061.1~~GHVL01020061.1.p1  ORF type:complete len:284 (+),score=56.83 GHVL01020061.1:214-1065(+)